MFKMILAEDESIVRHGLKNIINWSELDIEIIAEASDGNEAFDLCKKLNPDILFTDIRMPIMDGLELALKLKEIGSNIRIVFISGAQDFNYAKTALDVDADGYILKPVNAEVLYDVFKKVTNWLNLENHKQSELILMREQLQEHLPYIREKFLRNLVLGNYSQQLNIKDQVHYYKIPIKVNESIAAAILQVDDYHKIIEDNSEEYKQYLIFRISDILKETILNYNAGVSFCLNDNEYIIIFNEATQLYGKYIQICDELSKGIDKFMNLSVSIGIGSWVSDILSMNLSYRDALTALQYKFYTGKKSILDINDINIINDIGRDHMDSINIYESENVLLNFIKIGDCKGALNVLEDMFGHLYLNKNIPVEYIQSICVELICIISRTIQSLGKSLDNIVDNQSTIHEEIYKIESLDDLKDYISDIIFKVTEYFSKKYSHKNIKIVNKIKDIIEQRYSEDISITEISEEIYLSPNYISMIFKQEINQTITDYIIKVRMERAKNLLKSTDYKILEIAREVGYEDPHYFSKAFKKYTGINPLKYRE